MEHVYLLCSAGVSTSMLASKMQGVANPHDLPIKVEAFPNGEIGQIINGKHPDVILLEPQVKYRYVEIVKRYGNSGIPIQVIGQTDYGMMNGEKVLKPAIGLMRSARQRIAERPGVLSKIPDMGEIGNVK